MSRTAIIIAGLGAAILMLALLAMPGLTLSGVTEIRGLKQVEASLSGRDLGPHIVEIPGLMANAQLPDGARIKARWDVRVPSGAPAGPWAVWLERPQYASRVTWDAEVVGGSGDVDGTDRSEASVLALLPRPPDWQGPHQLELELVGDHHAGGLIGRMIVGPQDQVVRYAMLVQAEGLGLVLLLAGIGLMQFLISSGAQKRDANMLFGALCLMLAAYVFSRSGLALQVLPDPVGAIRMRRFASAFLVPFALGSAATFDHRNLPTWFWALFGLASTLALGGLLLPVDWLRTLENVIDVFLVCGAIAVPFLVVPMVLRKRPGATVLAVATIAPVVVGLFMEVAVTNGIIAGSTGLLPALSSFVIGMTVAFALRDATAGERHVALVQGSPDGILGIDRSGRVTDANPAVQRLLGRSPINTQFLDWVVADDQGIVRAQLERAPDGEARAEFRIRGQDRVLESAVTPLDPSTTLVMLRDVTERRAVEASRLQRARGETMTLLVGGLAHDFNNMLGTLLAHVGFLQLTAKAAPMHARLNRMEATLVRASNLTRRLLNLAGTSGTPLGPTSLHTVLANAAELVGPTLPSRVELDIDVPEVLPDIAGSAPDLEHVFVNLLVNARNAVGLAGHIRVIARPFSDGGVQGVICAVEDDGAGVPAGEHERIFSPFVKGDSATGSGLGLAVAQQVLREHQGRIWIEDRPGGGARFCVALHDASLLTQQQDRSLTPGTTVVLAEDESEQRRAARMALESAGCTVFAFADGAEAAESTEALDRIDVLVTDFLLPGTDGVALARSLREHQPDLPVLLMSAHLPDEIELDEPVKTIPKPVRAAHLVAHVHALLEEEEVDVEPTGIFPSLEGLSWASTRWQSPPPTPGHRSEAE